MYADDLATSVGTQSGNAGPGFVTIALDAYSFFPGIEVQTSTNANLAYPNGTSPDADAPDILLNLGVAQDYDAAWRYVDQ